MDYENWEREDAIDSRWGGENGAGVGFEYCSADLRFKLWLECGVVGRGED
jgi:hypothetical protein